MQKTGHQISIYNFNYTPLPYSYRADYEDDIYYVHGTSSNIDIIVGTKDDNISGKYEFLQSHLTLNMLRQQLYMICLTQIKL